MIPFYLFKRAYHYQGKGKLIYLTDGRFVYPYGLFEKVWFKKKSKTIEKNFTIMSEPKLPNIEIPWEKRFPMKFFQHKAREALNFWTHPEVDKWVEVLHKTVEFRDLQHEARVLFLLYSQLKQIFENYIDINQLIDLIATELLGRTLDDLEKAVYRNGIFQIFYRERSLISYTLRIPYDNRKTFYHKDLLTLKLGKIENFLRRKGYEIQPVQLSD